MKKDSISATLLIMAFCFAQFVSAYSLSNESNHRYDCRKEEENGVEVVGHVGEPGNLLSEM